MRGMYLSIRILDGNALSTKYSRRVEEEEIEAQTEALRRKLLQNLEKGRGGGANAKGLKMHQVHELAEAKIKQDNKFRSALGISKNYEEGSHWKKNEERRMARMENLEKEGRLSDDQ
jgi:hypothetical protein